VQRASLLFLSFRKIYTAMAANGDKEPQDAVASDNPKGKVPSDAALEDALDALREQVKLATQLLHRLERYRTRNPSDETR
jgi:hypothetical protein